MPSELGGIAVGRAGDRGSASPSNRKQWLAAEQSAVQRRQEADPQANGRGRDLNGNGNGAAPATADRLPRRRKLPKRGSARERWLVRRLRRSRDQVDEQKKEIHDLRERLTDLERSGSKTARNGSYSASRAEGPVLDLNQAKFEELRALGLTVTQSARLVAHRESGGSCDSIDDLKQIPGIGPATIEKLRELVDVDA